ncbi:MAG TPA: hypothetical protein VGD55_04285 [Acidothermaceae bacterium]
MMGGMRSGIVTRQEVQQWWSDLVAGRRSRIEASDWAEQWLGGSGEELVVQGLLALQAVRHSVLSDLELRPQMADALARWQQELRLYDVDPDAWNRSYFKRLLLDFARRHGAEPARKFGLKLVRSGQLREPDIEDALRSLD